MHYIVTNNSGLIKKFLLSNDCSLIVSTFMDELRLFFRVYFTVRNEIIFIFNGSFGSFYVLGAILQVK